MFSVRTTGLIAGVALLAGCGNEPNKPGPDTFLQPPEPGRVEYLRTNSVALASHLKAQSHSFTTQFLRLAVHVDACVTGKSVPFLRNASQYDELLKKLSNECSPLSPMLNEMALSSSLSLGFRTVAVDLVLLRGTLEQKLSLVQNLASQARTEEWLLSRACSTWSEAMYKDPSFISSLQNLTRGALPSAFTPILDSLAVIDPGQDARRAVLGEILHHQKASFSQRLDALYRLSGFTLHGFGDRSFLLPTLHELAKELEATPALGSQCETLFIDVFGTKVDRPTATSNSAKLYESGGILGDNDFYHKALKLYVEVGGDQGSNLALPCIQQFVYLEYLDPSVLAADLEKLILHCATNSIPDSRRDYTGLVSLYRSLSSPSATADLVLRVVNSAREADTLDPDLMRTSFARLRAIGTGEARKLTQLLSRPETPLELQHEAVKILGALPDAQQIDFLIRIAEEVKTWPDEARWAYFEALGRTAAESPTEKKDSARAILLTWSKCEDVADRGAATLTLGFVITPELQSMLEKQLKDPARRMAALGALARANSSLARGGVYAVIDNFAKRGQKLSSNLFVEIFVDYLATDSSTDSVERLKELADSAKEQRGFEWTPTSSRLVARISEALWKTGDTGRKIVVENFLAENDFDTKQESPYLKAAQEHLEHPLMAITENAVARRVAFLRVPLARRCLRPTSVDL